MIDFDKNTVNLAYFMRIMRELYVDEMKLSDRILDSFSNNQFSSKIKLVEMLEQLGAINPNSHVTVLGSWFNSILAASLVDKVGRIDGYDIDETAVKMGKRLYSGLSDKVNFFHNDAMKLYSESNIIFDTDVFINTSCEHMKPMSNFAWQNLKKNSYFALQSNNMFGIEGHINCVNSMEEFRNQLPREVLKMDKPYGQFKILMEDELIEERGTRYTIIGKFTAYNIKR